MCIEFLQYSFVLQDGEIQTRQLLTALNATREILLTPASPHGQFVIRVCINHEHATEADIDKSWSIIQTGINNFYRQSHFLKLWLRTAPFRRIEECRRAATSYIAWLGLHDACARLPTHQHLLD